MLPDHDDIDREWTLCHQQSGCSPTPIEEPDPRSTKELINKYLAERGPGHDDMWRCLCESDTGSTIQRFIGKPTKTSLPHLGSLNISYLKLTRRMARLSEKSVAKTRSASIYSHTSSEDYSKGTRFKIFYGPYILWNETRMKSGKHDRKNIAKVLSIVWDQTFHQQKGTMCTYRADSYVHICHRNEAVSPIRKTPLDAGFSGPVCVPLDSETDVFGFVPKPAKKSKRAPYSPKFTATVGISKASPTRWVRSPPENLELIREQGRYIPYINTFEERVEQVQREPRAVGVRATNQEELPGPEATPRNILTNVGSPLSIKRVDGFGCDNYGQIQINEFLWRNRGDGALRRQRAAQFFNPMPDLPSFVKPRAIPGITPWSRTIFHHQAKPESWRYYYEDQDLRPRYRVDCVLEREGPVRYHPDTRRPASAWIGDKWPCHRPDRTVHTVHRAPRQTYGRHHVRVETLRHPPPPPQSEEPIPDMPYSEPHMTVYNQENKQWSGIDQKNTDAENANRQTPTLRSTQTDAHKIEMRSTYTPPAQSGTHTESSILEPSRETPAQCVYPMDPIKGLPIKIHQERVPYGNQSMHCPPESSKQPTQNASIPLTIALPPGLVSHGAISPMRINSGSHRQTSKHGKKHTRTREKSKTYLNWTQTTSSYSISAESNIQNGPQNGETLNTSKNSRYAKTRTPSSNGPPGPLNLAIPDQTPMPTPQTGMPTPKDSPKRQAKQDTIGCMHFKDCDIQNCRYLWRNKPDIGGFLPKECKFR